MAICGCGRSSADRRAVESGDGTRNSACLQGQAPPRSWEYVGEGRGPYNRNTSYNFVGDGMGSYEIRDEVSAHGWKFRRSCLVLLCVLVAAGAISIIAVILATPLQSLPAVVAASPFAPAPATGTQQRGAVLIYNCDSEANMTPMKGNYCCVKLQKFCDVQPGENGGTQPVPTHVPGGDFDCEAGFNTWQQAWSFMKKDWCCRHRNRGCATGQVGGTDGPSIMEVHQPPMPFTVDCSEGYDNWRKGWSDAKKAYCCEHKQRGCPERRL